MESDILLYNEENGIVTLTLNRPEVMNSVNFDLLNACKNQIEKIRFNSKIRVVIITSAGEKAFCAGADLKERITLNPTQVKEFIFTIRTLFYSIDNLSKPTIAAINGLALGGGTELALACDLRVMSQNASMGLTETKLAIIPGAGGTQRMPRLIGPAKAKELIFTGRRVKAQEALDIGLVNYVCPHESLLSKANELASMICETGPVAIEQAKYAINHGLETDLQTGLAIESNAYWVTIPTEDRLEGLKAFREKRKPVYTGK